MVRWDDALGLPLWTDSFLHLKHNLYSVYYIIMKVRSQKSKSCGFSTLLSPKTKLYSLITPESYLCESGLNPLKESKIRFGLIDATSWAWEKSPLRDMNDDGPWLLKQGLLWDLSACMHVWSVFLA